MLLPRSMIFLLLMTGAASADPLADMNGSWRGSGWAKETPQSAREAVRCQIKNEYADASMTLTLTGQCVVPGRRLNISGTLIGSDISERITGRRSNPDGVGSVRIVGIQRDGIVAFNFNATDPATGRALAQNVEWRVSDGTLRLRSTDRNDPSIMLSELSFSQ